MMTVTQLQEQINRIVNIAMGNLGPGGGQIANPAAIATVLTNAATAVTALSGVNHDRTIQDPGSALNPAQP